MNSSTLKTSGFQADGMTFTALHEELAKQVRKGKLNDEAELRWTNSRGLYAKNGVSNTGANYFQRRFGSGLLNRGVKYLAAREEVARSINLTHGFHIHEGQWIGDFVIDRVLSERAEAQAREVLHAKMPLGEQIPWDELQAEIARQKKTMTLQFNDLASIQDKLDAISRQGALRPPVGDAERARLINSVGYLSAAPKSGRALIQGTEQIVRAIAQDFIDVEHRKGDASSYYERPDALRSYAYEKAWRILKKLGLEKQRIDGERTSILPGGLTRSNVERVRKEIRKEDIPARNLLALLHSADLPKAIYESGQRIMDECSSLNRAVTALTSEEANQQLERMYDPFTKKNVAEQLKAAKSDILNLTANNRIILRDLKRLSFPADLDNDDARIDLNARLMHNIAILNGRLKELNAVAEPELKYLVRPLDKAIAEVFTAAQLYCSETLKLADAVSPRKPALRVGLQEARPFDMQLDGVMSYGNPNGFGDQSPYDVIISDGLSRKLEPPDILFQAADDNTDTLDRLRSMQSHRLDYIHGEYRQYLDLVGSKESHCFTADEHQSISMFQATIANALKDNERITHQIKQRQKIFGQTENRSVNIQLRYARHQRNALLLLLYPRQVQPYPNGKEHPWLDKLARHTDLDAFREDSRYYRDDPRVYKGDNLELYSASESSGSVADSNDPATVHLKGGLSKHQLDFKVISPRDPLDLSNRDNPPRLPDNGQPGIPRYRGGGDDEVFDIESSVDGRDLDESVDNWTQSSDLSDDENEFRSRRDVLDPSPPRSPIIAGDDGSEKDADSDMASQFTTIGAGPFYDDNGYIGSDDGVNDAGGADGSDDFYGPKIDTIIAGDGEYSPDEFVIVSRNDNVVYPSLSDLKSFIRQPSDQEPLRSTSHKMQHKERRFVIDDKGSERDGRLAQAAVGNPAPDNRSRSGPAVHDISKSCAAVLSAETSKAWLNQLSTDMFLTAQNLNDGQKPLHEEVREAFETSINLARRVQEALAQADQNARPPLARAARDNAAALVQAYHKLADFNTAQENQRKKADEEKSKNEKLSKAELAKAKPDQKTLKEARSAVSTASMDSMRTQMVVRKTASAMTQLQKIAANMRRIASALEPAGLHEISDNATLNNPDALMRLDNPSSRLEN